MKVIVNTLENGQDIFRVLDNEPVFFLKPALGAGGTLFMIANQAGNVKAIPHKSKQYITAEIFSSECIKDEQAGWRLSNRLCAL
ncbi:hypothetical protein D1841_00105 [Neglecta sp. X4]|nr:hypothetical protein [Neglectibacter sp. 59]NBJ71762.1 hypothetical protein [Neglectibacter sp. X4]NCE79539.1 hypothetical protein [Neglectibacter sp. X58]